MTEFVVTHYRGKGKFAKTQTRLHRADCRTLKPTTRTSPFTSALADGYTTRHCKVCKPQPNEARNCDWCSSSDDVRATGTEGHVCCHCRGGSDE